mmetsp:Transcript_31540/g.101922  ORF Transcript_31540/g.101922 Transcript_31540/m.101922 type:complete len:266 (+) Transcript_31540:68-865(+)
MGHFPTLHLGGPVDLDQQSPGWSHPRPVRTYTHTPTAEIRTDKRREREGVEVVESNGESGVGEGREKLRPPLLLPPRRGHYGLQDLDSHNRGQRTQPPKHRAPTKCMARGCDAVAVRVQPIATDIWRRLNRKGRRFVKQVWRLHGSERPQPPPARSAPLTQNQIRGLATPDSCFRQSRIWRTWCARFSSVWRALPPQNQLANVTERKRRASNWWRSVSPPQAGRSAPSWRRPVGLEPPASPPAPDWSRGSPTRSSRDRRHPCCRR